MYDKSTQGLDRRKLISSLLLGGLWLPMSAYTKTESSCQAEHANLTHTNPLLWAVAWSATAAEFGALCYQAFNLATLRVE
jgi:predicted secreted acid phosphatase